MVYTIYWRDTKFEQLNVVCKGEKEGLKPDRDPNEKFGCKMTYAV